MASVDDGSDSHGQETVLGRSPPDRQARQRVRHRASVACAACRDRRVRCVVPKGETACMQCRRTGSECVIKNDDERRRPISKAYMSSLSDRIRLLEGMLLGQGVVPPPAVHPPKTRQEGQGDREGPEGQQARQQQQQQQQLPTALPEPDDRLLSEPARRAEGVIEALAPATRDHLMDCFWTHHNDAACVVERAAFEADRADGRLRRQRQRFCTPFLHIAMLAIGFRSADHGREDVGRLGRGRESAWESSLHDEARHMLDAEELLSQPGGVASVQALLLLGDLECGVGRTRSGWLCVGMAGRLAVDLGLHQKSGGDTDGRSAAAAAVGRMAMRAVVVADRFWSVFLGRSAVLDGRFSRLGSTAASDSLVALLGLAGEIAETAPDEVADASAFLRAVRLDRRLQSWYRRLPDCLAWRPVNVQTASESFFLLHQQYHVCMILLHRPWARSAGCEASSKASSKASSATVDHGRTVLPRAICSQQAVRVAHIFWHHRRRFHGRRIHVTAVQHASTAAPALLASLADCSSGSPESHVYQSCLAVLSAALAGLRQVYQPAAHALAQLPTDSYVPADAVIFDLVSHSDTAAHDCVSVPPLPPPHPALYTLPPLDHDGSSSSSSSSSSGSRSGIDGIDGIDDIDGIDGKAAASLGWMDVDGSLDALSPVGLGGLVVQPTDKMAAETIFDGRNHDLDFFRF